MQETVNTADYRVTRRAPSADDDDLFNCSIYDWRCAVCPPGNTWTRWTVQLQQQLSRPPVPSQQAVHFLPVSINDGVLVHTTRCAHSCKRRLTPITAGIKRQLYDTIWYHATVFNVRSKTDSQPAQRTRETKITETETTAENWWASRFRKSVSWVEWVSSFLTAHQHIIGYSVLWKDR